MKNCSKCSAAHCNNISLCDDCISKSDVQVGYVEVVKAFDYEESFSSASQYRTIYVEPGKYPIMLAQSRFDNVRYVAVCFTGKVVASGYGNKRYDNEIGTLMTCRDKPYKYTLRSNNYYYGKTTLTDLATFEGAAGI